MVTPVIPEQEPAVPFFSNDEGNEAIAAALDAEVASEETAAEGGTPAPGAAAQGAAPGAATPPPVAGIPASTAPPTIPAPPAPVLDDYTKQRLAWLDELERRQTAQAAQQAIEQEALRYQQDLEAQGFMPEQARFVAQKHRETLARTAQERQQQQQQVAYEQGKRNAAQFYAEKYGVAASSLLDYSSPQAMETAAQQQKELKDLRAEVEKAKQERVQPQRFDRGQGTPRAVGTNRQKIRDDYIAGRIKLTTEQAKAAGII